MIESIRDFLGDLSGYRPLYLKTLTEMEEAKGVIAQLTLELAEAKEKIRQLELLVPRPAPPIISAIYERDTAWVQQCIDGMDLGIIRFELDSMYHMTNQSNFLNVVAWDWCDSLEYVKHLFDCENFAILFKAFVDLYFRLNQVAIILDYKSAHAYNLVVFPDGNMSVLETESDAMYVWTKRPVTFYPLKGAIALI